MVVVHGGTVCPFFFAAVLGVDTEVVHVGVHVVLTSVRVGRVNVHRHVVDVLCGGRGIVLGMLRHARVGQWGRRRNGRFARRTRVGGLAQVLGLLLFAFELEKVKCRRVIVARLVMLLLLVLQVMVLEMVGHQQLLGGRLLLRRHLYVRREHHVVGRRRLVLLLVLLQVATATARSEQAGQRAGERRRRGRGCGELMMGQR